jgi:hypothetical protein
VANFLPGRDLCRAFYNEVLAPLVQVPHSAGLLGPGSDVLGYDTERSTDHDWGPRCTVLVAEPSVADVRERILTALPPTFRGWPVSLGRDDQPPMPQVVVDSPSAWLRGQLGWGPGADGLSTGDWLLVPQQRLLGITEGAVLADSDGTLDRLRRRLAWYPDDVWWWLLASQWGRLAQEEPFVQRTAEVGDDLGSRMVAGRLVRDCMRLALLLARRYAPYSKWLGTAFSRLPDADELTGLLADAMAASSLQDRETALGHAYVCLGARFNALTDGPPVDTTLGPFWDRPALVIHAGRFAAAALARVSDPVLATLPLIGSVDQLLDSTDVLDRPDLTAALRGYYRSLGFPP